jgi:uncharacterized protein
MKNKNIEEWQQIFEEILVNYSQNDDAHSIGHIRRVWKVAQQIMEMIEKEQTLPIQEIDKEVVLAACYFHDIVNVPKNSSERQKASFLASLEAEIILNSITKKDFPKRKVVAVKHCIEAHSFSANVACQTIEAKIVQDADRMEAIGNIGIARVFYTAGRLGSQLFDVQDPYASNRPLDDTKFALDHFYTKLLKLQNTFQTQAGKEIATLRTQKMLIFLEGLAQEI